ncbi:MAG: hypothetical protein ABII64_02335 [Elusimicrobiota bacterium]
MYRKIMSFLSILLILVPCSFADIHFGMTSAVRKKIKDLKEKITSEKQKIITIEKISDSNGKVSFTLPNGETVTVRLVNQQTATPVNDIKVILITDQECKEGAYLIVDTKGRYLPRIVNCYEKTNQTSSGAPRKAVFSYLTKEIPLFVKASINGDEGYPLFTDNVPIKISSYILTNPDYFTFWRSSYLKDLQINVRDFVAGEAVGYLAGAAVASIPCPLLSGILLVTGTLGLLNTATHEYWYILYKVMGYNDSDMFDIYKPGPVFLSAFVLPVIYPRDPNAPFPSTVRSFSISGKITDDHGLLVEGADVALVPNGSKITTSSDGKYSFSEIPLYTIEHTTITLVVCKIGYQQTNLNVSIPPTSIYGLIFENQDIVLKQLVSSEYEYRFTLYWDENPFDLDSHLWTPAISGTAYHIYFMSKGSLTSAPYANLDFDDTTSWGPENVTIKTLYPGTYKYSVHHYAGTGSLTTSGAYVEVYDKDGYIATYNVPTSGSGVYWNIFELDGTTRRITVNNSISTDPSISYSLRLGQSMNEILPKKEK